METRIDIINIQQDDIYRFLGNKRWCPSSETELRSEYSSNGFISFTYDDDHYNTYGIYDYGTSYTYGFRMSGDGKVIYRTGFNGESDLDMNMQSDVDYVPYSTVPPVPLRDYLAEPIDFGAVDEEAQMKYIESFMKQIEAISKKLTITPVKGDLVQYLQAEWVSTDDPKYLDVPYDEAKKAIMDDSKDKSSNGYFLIERTGYVRSTKTQDGRLLIGDGSRYVRLWKVLDKDTLIEKTIDPEEVKTLVSGLRALCTANNYTEGNEIIGLMEADLCA